MAINAEVENEQGNIAWQTSQRCRFADYCLWQVCSTGKYSGKSLGKRPGGGLYPIGCLGPAGRKLCPLSLQGTRGISRGPYAGKKL